MIVWWGVFVLLGVVVGVVHVGVLGLFGKGFFVMVFRKSGVLVVGVYGACFLVVVLWVVRAVVGGIVG